MENSEIKTLYLDETITSYIDKNKHLCKGINFGWFFDIAHFFYENGIEDEIIKDVLLTIFTENNLNNMRKSDFMSNVQRINQQKNFFEYLKNLKKEDKKEYIENGIRYALETTDEKGNFIDSFIRYVVITNYSDIEVISTVSQLNKDNDAYVNARLGGLEICHNRNLSLDEDGNVQFEWFHVRQNMRGLHLGKLVFQRFLSDVKENFPGYDVIARNVKKSNTGAQRFYVANGGQLFDNETGEFLDISMIDSTQNGSVGVFYDKAKFDEIINQPWTTPTIDEKYQTKSKTNNEIVLK